MFFICEESFSLLFTSEVVAFPGTVHTMLCPEESESYERLILQVNADFMAGEIAAATNAAKILFLTDVDGLYLDFDDKDTLVSQLSLEEARDLIDGGTLSSGMIPKLRSCVSAIEGGVPSAYIVNGTIPHSILLELLTLSGVGTAVYADTADAKAPVGNFASKLLENK